MSRVSAGQPLAVVTKDAFVTWEMKELGRAARRQSRAIVVLDPRRISFDVTHGAPCLRNMERQRPTAVLGRVDVDALQSGARLLKLLQRAHFPVLNDADAFTTGRDKAEAALALSAAALPHPPTWVLGRPSEEWPPEGLTYPIVVKPIVGSGGRGVRLIRSAKRLAAIPQTRFPLLAQAYCGPVRRDLRLLVLQGQPLGAVVRTPAKGEWRSNSRLGATSKQTQVSEAVESLAVDATRAIGADFAAVDLIESDDGINIIEVNVCPGFEHFSHVTGVDVAQQLVSALVRIGERTLGGVPQ